MNAIFGAVPMAARTAIAIALLFYVACLYGVARGFALPSAAIFYLTDPAFVSRVESNLATALVLAAFAGASAQWFARAAKLDEEPLRRAEVAAAALLHRWGWIVFSAAFMLALAAAGGWSGSPTFNSASAYSIGGLVPGADTHEYFVSPVQHVLTGHWNVLASRRPIGAAFRETLEALSGFSYTRTLLVQALLCGVALHFAFRSVVAWRGLWSGIAFAAFVYVGARQYLPTLLTETLGLFWALLATGFFAQALRLRSLPHAFLGLTTIAIAQAVRMGSVFTIPALVLWIPFAFAKGLRNRAMVLAAAAGIVGLILGIQGLCASLYGDASTVTGANVGETLCGLAAGKNWTACPEMFAAQLSHMTTEREKTAFLVAKAIELASENPKPMMFRAAENVRNFLAGLPRILLFGDFVGRPQLLILIFLAAVFPGLVLSWLMAVPGERSFWTAVFTSIIASAAVILQAGGWRAMLSTWPLVACFFSLAFRPPPSLNVEPPKAEISARRGAWLVSALVGGIVAGPTLATLWYQHEFAELGSAAVRTEERILLRSSITGFLVVADHSGSYRLLSAIPVSTFVHMVQDFGLEAQYGPFLDKATAHLPVAFFAAARIDRPAEQSPFFYVGPPEILTGAAAEAWRVRVSTSGAASDGALQILSFGPVEGKR